MASDYTSTESSSKQRIFPVETVVANLLDKRAWTLHSIGPVNRNSEHIIMGIPQTGILAEANTDALFLVLSIESDGVWVEPVRKTCARIPAMTQTLSDQYPKARLVSTISLASSAWDRLHPEFRPAELRPFNPVTDGDRTALATSGDILLHIRSDRRDINYLLMRQVMDSFGESVRVVEEESCFRYLDSRDLTGFVDGTENPQGQQRAAVALVAEEDSHFSGGSYIHTQKYVHRLRKWTSIDVSEQERVIGRTKEDNIEFGRDEKAPTAHVKRANIKSGDGRSMEILRHSMPFGSACESGLYFISYCRTPLHFEKMLESMIRTDGLGHYDHLMNYSQAVTGCAFFAPSINFLQKNYRE